MRGAPRCYLWQVGDADYLTVAIGHLLHYHAHLLGYLAADASVYLVEDDGGEFHRTAYHCFDGKHDACYLSTRCYLADGSHLGAGVRTEEERHLVASVLRQRFLIDGYAEAHFRDAQRYQPLLHLLLYCGGCLAPLLCKCRSFVYAFFVQLFHLCGQLLKFLVAVLDVRKLLCKVVLNRHKFFYGAHAMLLLQRVDGV